MPNEPREFKNVSLEVRHVPEPEETFDPSAHDVAEPVTGFVDICAVVDGVSVVLARRKASGLIADINRAKASAPSPPPAEQPSEQPPLPAEQPAEQPSVPPSG